MIFHYSKCQQDALLFPFLLIKNSTCFVQIYCPSSGVFTLYSQHFVFIIMLAVLSAYFATEFSCLVLILFFFGVLIFLCLFCLLGLDEFDKCQLL